LETDQTRIGSSSVVGNIANGNKEDQPASTTTTLYDLIQRHIDTNYPNKQMELDLQTGVSLDPAGKEQVDLKEPLMSQPFTHGTMLHCRFRGKENDNLTTASPSSSNTVTWTGKAESNPSEDQKNDVTDNSIKDDSTDTKINNCRPQKNAEDDDDDVIDLCDDDDDDSNDDDEVVVVEKESLQAKSSSSSSVFLSKKRKSVTMMNTPNSTAAGGTGHSSTKKKSRQSNDNNNGQIDQFQIASYNVWFGPHQQDESGEVFPKDRMAAIAQHLQEATVTSSSPSSPLLFIGFQELTPSLTTYLKPCLYQMGYKFCSQPFNGGFGGGSWYGVGLAIPHETEIIETKFVPFDNSIQGRGMFFVQTKTVLFVTTHLESWSGPEYTGAREREAQLVAAASFCQQRMKEQTLSSKSLSIAIIAGDLNWDDERKRSSGRSNSSAPPNRKLLDLLDDGWKDPAEAFDYTYDSKENPMLSGSLRRRFDRCIYYSRDSTMAARSSDSTKTFRAVEFRKIGKDPIVPSRIWNKRNTFNGTTRQVPVCASDHFGIVVGFNR
jgi:hypothetical protein